jgi:hypothetical protein
LKPQIVFLNQNGKNGLIDAHDLTKVNKNEFVITMPEKEKGKVRNTSPWVGRGYKKGKYTQQLVLLCVARYGE